MFKIWLFPFWGSRRVLGQYLNIIDIKGLEIKLELFWYMRIDRPWWQWALLGFKFEINFRISCLSMFVIVWILFVTSLAEGGMELKVAVHCWLKKFLKW